MTIGNRVREMRKKKGLTQDELASMLGYKSKSSVAHIENGRDIPRSMVAKLAQLLDTTPGYLMGWEDKQWIMTDEGPELSWVAEERLKKELAQNEAIEKEMKRLIFLPVIDVKNVSPFLKDYLKEREQRDIISFFPYLIHDNENKDDLVFVSISDDKMAPIISRGDVVLVNLGKKPLNDSLALIAVSAGSGFICRIRYASHYIEFGFSNSYEYPPLKVYADDKFEYDRYKPFGVVEEIRKYTINRKEIHAINNQISRKASPLPWAIPPVEESKAIASADVDTHSLEEPPADESMFENVPKNDV